MSGIAGFVAFDGTARNRPQLDAMVDAMSYRGPDGVDAVVSDMAALAQLWLRATPQSIDAKAPFVSPGGASVVGDVRLDERGSLGTALGLNVEALDDLELVGRSFDRWGRHAFHNLRGDFAIAIWEPQRRRLFLARDIFGVKPLFYAWRGSTVYFASQPTAIVAHSDVAVAPDTVRIAAELLEVPPPPERSYFDGVRRVVPAHFMEFSPTGPRSERYWELGSESLSAMGDVDYAEEFRKRLLASVSDRLRSSGPVAFDLSGGLDSTSVVGAARHLQGPEAPLRTYSVAVFGPGDGDHRLSSLATRAMHTTHTAIPVNDAFDRALMGWRFGSSDSPGTIDGPLFQMLGWPIARSEGAIAVLGGMHGDTVILHGYPRLLELTLTGRFGALRREVRLLEERSILPARSSIRFWVIRPLLPRALVDWISNRRYRARGEWVPEPVGSIELCSRAGARLPSRLGLAGGDDMNVRQAIRAGIQHPEIVEYLEDLDLASARVGIELRHPYCDRRLVQFSYSIPSALHLRDGWTRRIQRLGLEGLAPDEVRWRPDKGGFFKGFQSALLTSEWREVTAMCRTGGRFAGLAYRPALRRLYEAGSSGDDAALASLYRLRRLDHWLEAHGFEIGLR
jgi:asparagine synthase (glutamine-hydrolysing)